MNSKYRILREKMVEDQMRKRGITEEEILNVFSTIPREEFLPPEFKGNAYSDKPESIGFGQTISQPYMTALMTSVLSPRKGEKILEIGTGSGYQTAILAGLGANVYTIEKVPELSLRAFSLLRGLGYEVRLEPHPDFEEVCFDKTPQRKNDIFSAAGMDINPACISIKVGDGTLGWEENSPFSGIIVTAGSFKVPDPVLKQLSKGGRVVIPLGGRLSQNLVKITKISGSEFKEEKICGCMFVPLLGKYAWNGDT